MALANPSFPLYDSNKRVEYEAGNRALGNTATWFGVDYGPSCKSELGR